MSHAIPDASHALPDTSCAIPDTSHVIPDASGAIPDMSHAISNASRTMTDAANMHSASRPSFEAGDNHQHTVGSDDEGPCTGDISLQGLFSFDHSPQSFYISSIPDILRRGAEPSEDDLKWLKLWAQKQATNYKILNGIEGMRVDLTNMKNMVEVVTSRLKGSFELSVDQMMQVTITCKDMLVQAGCTKYKVLHTDVEEQLRSCADMQGFQNVFGNFGNEQVLCVAIKRKCSALRSKFCTLYQASGQEAMYDAGRTYMDGTQQIQRYYARAHQYIHPGPDASEASGIESGEEPGTGVEPPVKHAKTDLDQYGKDMKNDQWHDFFIEIVLTDQERYGKNSRTMLPPLPMTYTESHGATPGTTSTTPHSFPATTYHGLSRMQSFGTCPVTGASPCPSCGDSFDSLPTSDGTEELLGKDF
ncbi:hypothetical protein EDC04DRAFT_2605647 [Pisolithus marmoratus]|nr:hypothetical protein EDC04DRAFT_2605647 [Pisolithus marmoratus]